MIGTAPEAPYRVLPTLAHGVVDYAAAATLTLLPQFVRVRSTDAWIAYAGAVLAFGYAFLTRYELGVVPVIPMRVHLGLDFVYGASFLAVALLRNRDPLPYRIVVGAIGVTGLLASVITKTHPTREGLRQ